MISPSLLRVLRVCAAGKDAYLAEAKSRGTTLAILSGMLVERGLVRSVKHRDHTRTYALTCSGRAELKQAASGMESKP